MFRAGGWGAAVAGALSLVFGMVLLVNPLVDWIAWGQVYGWLSLAGGTIPSVLAVQMRRSSAMHLPDHMKEKA